MVSVIILGHFDTKTTRKSYARPSVEMLRQHMSKGTALEPEINEKEVELLWKNDEELARLCGIR